MIIETKYHGKMEVQKADIWRFDKGIPGFLEEKEFVLLPLPDNEVYWILQSVQTSELAFVVSDPFVFFSDYQFALDDLTLDQLDLKKKEEVLVLVILTVKEPFQNTTANLQAPLILNKTNRKGKQVILNDGKYNVRTPLFALQRG
ncbi:flagellar assembly protein FliW [Bacillus smithii]|uniref:flagellar assembly protein FliW n=1 Tax=Bacillus smithii TaxID=1479 RepID=UPI0030C91948